jgi:single-strand DNA-binding protein
MTAVAFNQVVLAGNLTRDVELRFTKSGDPVTDIGLAVNSRRKGADGQLIEEVTFIDVTLWGRTAEVASQYLAKGAPVLVSGRLRQETWEADGVKRSRHKVVANSLQMLGNGNKPASAEAATAAEEDGTAVDVPADETPF